MKGFQAAQVEMFKESKGISGGNKCQRKSTERKRRRNHEAKEQGIIGVKFPGEK